MLEIIAPTLGRQIARILATATRSIALITIFTALTSITAYGQRPGLEQPNRPGMPPQGRPGLSPQRPGLDPNRPGLGITTSRPGLTERNQRLGIQQVGEAVAEVARKPVNEAEILVDKADKLLEKGEVDEALKIYHKALDMQPKLFSAQVGIAYALFQQGEYDASDKQFLEAIENTPNSPEARLELGVALYRTGRIDDAINQYKQALEFKKKLPGVYFNMAMAFAHKGEFQEAIKHYKSAISLTRAYPEAHNNLGLVYEVIGEGEAAVSNFQQAISQKGGKYALAYYNLARQYYNNGKDQPAVENFLKATALDESFAEAYLDLGNVYLTRASIRSTNEYDKAIEAYRKAIALRNNFYPLAHDNLGIALAKKGRKQEALAEFQTAFEQADGVCPETLSNLVSTLSNGELFMITNELARDSNAGNLKTRKDNLREQIIARLKKNLVAYEQLDDELKDIAEVRFCAGLAYAATQDLKASAEEFEKALELSDNKHQGAQRGLERVKALIQAAPPKAEQSSANVRDLQCTTIFLKRRNLTW